MMDEESLLRNSRKKPNKVFKSVVALICSVLIFSIGFLIYIQVPENQSQTINSSIHINPTEATLETHETTQSTPQLERETSTRKTFIFNFKEITKSTTKKTTTTVEPDYVDDSTITQLIPTTEEPFSPFKSHPNYKMFSNVKKVFPLSSTKIRFGIPARVGEYPWTVALFSVPHDNLTAVPSYYCSGSLIADNWIVTAAHCIKQNKVLVSIRLGEHDFRTEIDYDKERNFKADPIQVYGIGEFETFVHDDFDNSTKQNDIALIKLLSPAKTYQNNIKAIRLPLYNESITPYKVFIAGWGWTEWQNTSKVILSGLIYTRNGTDCRKLFNNENDKAMTSISNDQFCGLGKNDTIKETIKTCEGDSGGAAFALNKNEPYYVLYGITSWGLPGCTYGYEPTVFVKVYSFINWILKMTEVN